MKKRQIINIINFIRGCEPRMDMDLHKPVTEQVKLVNKYDLPSTFLLQYDALEDESFKRILDGANGKTEYGVWLEVVEPQCKAAGVKWNGRYAWDWYANAGFTVAYCRRDREKLADALFEKFKETFGYYPRVIGSWAIDAYTLSYISDKYEIDASCTCKEQWGTDGYTFWGGYDNQGYYPCRNNMLCPAQTDGQQLRYPVFRMLGSDPIYQYDTGLDVNGEAAKWQHVVTLEPVYCGGDGGGNPEWVDWYFGENFNGKCLTFGYTQAGQENSFGWGAMGAGLTYQIGKISQLVNEGKAETLTLGETGAWFKDNFKSTPASVVSAFTDRHEQGRKSVWYDCKNYRANVYTEEGKFRIRDIYLFCEDYKERYLDSVNKDPSMLFDNLPFVDGNRFSGNGIRAGLYPVCCGKELTYDAVEYAEGTEGEESVTLTFTNTQCGTFRITLRPDGVSFTADKPFALENRYKKDKSAPERIVSGDTMHLRHNNFDYEVSLACGSFIGCDLISSGINGAENRVDLITLNKKAD